MTFRLCHSARRHLEGYRRARLAGEADRRPLPYVFYETREVLSVKKHIVERIL